MTSRLDLFGHGGHGVPPPAASLNICNAGTKFINGRYSLVKQGKIIKYVRSCIHPTSKISFTVEIVRKPLFLWTGNEDECYVIQGYGNTQSQSQGQSQSDAQAAPPEDSIIDYYILSDDKNGNWDEIAGLSPKPEIIRINNNNNKNKKEKEQNAVTVTTSSFHNNNNENNDDDSKIEATIKTYLTDTYKFILDKNCQIVGFGTDIKYGDYIILNNTIFHPQGGGQPSDIGIIKSKNGKIVFNVTFVGHNGNLIYHYGKYSDENESSDSDSNGRFNVNDEIIEIIDEKTRIEHAKCHSAGHLLDIGLSLIGKGCNILKPLKGYHFMKGSYVEYAGSIDTKERPKVRLELENELNLMIKKEVNSKIIFYNKEEYCEKYIDEWNEYSNEKKKDMLDSLKTSFGKIRVVTWDAQAWFNDNNNNNNKNVKKMDEIPLGEYGCMCGGTHIDNTRRIKQIHITKLKRKGKNVRVFYTVE